MWKRLLVLLCLLPLSAQAQSAGSYINQLTAGVDPTGAELIPVWQNNATVRLSLKQFLLGLFLPVVNGTCITGINGAWVAGSCSGVTGSGTVTTGVAKQLAYYPASSNSVAGLTTANNGVLITSGTGAPSISSTLPAAVQGNITSVGAVTSGALGGSVTGVTQAAGTSNTSLATTAFVNGTVLTLTDGSTAATQTLRDNSTKIATDAFVIANGSKLVQRAYAQYTTYTSTGSFLTFSGTPNTSSNGTTFVSVSITPTSATNILRIRIHATVAGAGGGRPGITLLQSGVINALAAAYGYTNSSAPNDLTIIYNMVAGTTSAITFSANYGDSSGTAYINGISGSALAGCTSAIEIEEVTP